MDVGFMTEAAELFKILSTDRGIEIIEFLKKDWKYYSLNREALEKCRQRLNRICTCGCLGKQVSVKNNHEGM
jgi:hypothetical protein